MFLVGNYENEKAILAANLLAARKKIHISQTELALRVGTEKSAISRYENGVQEPGLDMLRRLAEALGSTAGELLHPREESGSIDGMLMSLPPDRREVARTAIMAMLHGFGLQQQMPEGT